MTGRLTGAVVLLMVAAVGAGCVDGPSGDGPGGTDSATASARSSAGTEPSPSSKREKHLGPDEQRELNEQLVAAAWDNDVRRARQLIEQGADVDWRDDTVQNAFLIAASEGYLDLLELTIDAGADVRLHDSFDGTAIIRAAERGHWDVVGRLLRTPLRRQVDHVNNLGWVAMHEAIILGEATPDDVTTVRVLVAGGADLGIPSQQDGMTALEHAEERGQAPVVRTLEDAIGEAPGDPDAALLAAAEEGDADAATVALRAGADVDVRDGAGRTPLLIAVTRDHVEVAQVLLALGASPDALDGRHDTPWLVTGVTGSVPMAELLLKYDPDLTIGNRYGGVSIIPASERGHVEYVRRVVRAPIDINHVNDLGWTAMLEAVILGDGSEPYQEIVRILLDAGADPSIADDDGVTALEHARSRGHDEIARIIERAR